MKKLNRKGFTLIELLAVIVVLAIILVVTIPSVISSMNKAREEQFKNAVATVEDYMKKQIDACGLGDTSLVEYDTNIFTPDTCNIDTNKASDIVKNAGYTYAKDEADTDSDFASIAVTSAGKVTSATAGTNSKFNGVTYNG